jgi:hypothetical protein
MIPTDKEVQVPDNQQPPLPEDSKADDKGKAKETGVASANAGIVVISARDNHGYCFSFFLSSTWQTTNSIRGRHNCKFQNPAVTTQRCQTTPVTFLHKIRKKTNCF